MLEIARQKRYQIKTLKRTQRDASDFPTILETEREGWIKTRREQTNTFDNMSSPDQNFKPITPAALQFSPVIQWR